MDLIKFHLLFLFFIQINCMSAQVEPPSNVTLHCKNLCNILTWNYTKITPGLRFRVDINSLSGLNRCPQQLWVDQPLLQADVSCYSEPKDSYLVKVTAVIGDTESAPSPKEGITFSYYKDSDTKQKCYVDLPSVTITSQPQRQARFHFDHPCLLYHQKLPECKKSMKKNDEFGEPLQFFTYNVVVIGTGETHKFDCDERMCEEMLDMNDEHKFCLRIEGELETMSVKSTQEHYCTLPLSPSLRYTWPIWVSLAGFAALALIFYMVYRKITKPSTQLPKFMDRSISQPRPLQPVLDSPDEVCFVDPEPLSPTPLIPTTDEDCQDNCNLNNGSIDDVRMQIGISSMDDRAPGDMEERSPNGSRSPYMDGRDLDGKDVGAVLSEYESRAALF
ncbi:interferon gamma receptor 1-like isoform X2 [Melanotaenia boesemani]|uniref:interferon gamma receptor 1-like isoform X2 n=1 Tax=Melanotaenia boesemani TaxID=1250792 RepID=UPI001C057017|nr:interferon gamma receptor 1-like isoform X2 [Melanotaenia boesemani]